ncbi:MAG: cell division protein FtsZ [Bacteroidetes bacterium]|nr:cell division protein FtsZ [Bacteroidota bacterium]
MKFDLPKENSSIIKVLGIGGGGSNAVNHMFRQGIKGVDFLVCNTDQQALDISPIPTKLQLGATLTEGRGAGSLPEVGKNAAIENIEELKDIVNKNTKMVFITAGMGGGTGTGAAPVIAKAAKEMGILTVGIVTMPFFFEGKKRRQQAEQGIEEIRENVDTLLIINNEKLREMCGNLPIAEAFAMADDVLTTAAKGIAEIITRTGYINVDFEDVRTVMHESGVAIMGSAESEGENRATKAVEKALASQLLNDNNIEGARYVLLNITFGQQEVLMDEISDITDYIQEEAGASADVIWGYGHDESLGDSLSVTIIATGFKQNPNVGVNLERKQETRKLNLEDEVEVAMEEVKPVIHHLDDTVEMEEEAEVEMTREDEVIKEAELTTETPVVAEAPEEVEDSETPEVSEENQRTIEFDMSAERREVKLDSETSKTDESSVESKIESEPFLKSETQETSEAPETRAVFKLDGEPANKTEDWEPFKKEESEDSPQLRKVEDAPEESQPTDVSDEDQSKRNTDRMSRLRDLSLRLRTPSGMNELENEPAYKRKQINLDDVPHSSESTASRFTLSEEEGEDGESKTKLRPNNPFLHDNVD